MYDMCGYMRLYIRVAGHAFMNVPMQYSIDIVMAYIVMAIAYKVIHLMDARSRPLELTDSLLADDGSDLHISYGILVMAY